MIHRRESPMFLDNLCDDMLYELFILIRRQCRGTIPYVNALKIIANYGPAYEVIEVLCSGLVGIDTGNIKACLESKFTVYPQQLESMGAMIYRRDSPIFSDNLYDDRLRDLFVIIRRQCSETISYVNTVKILTNYGPTDEVIDVLCDGLVGIDVDEFGKVFSCDKVNNES